MDALNFAGTGIGPSTNVNTTIRTINGVAQPQVAYNTSFGSTFHTYKLVRSTARCTHGRWPMQSASCPCKPLA